MNVNPANYSVLNQNTTMAFENKEIGISGSVLMYHDPPNGPSLECKLGTEQNDGFILKPKTRVIAPFDKIYITLTTPVVGVNSVQLIFGKPANVLIESEDVQISNISAVSEVSNIINNERVSVMSHGVVACTATAASVKLSASTRKKLHLYNQGVNTVYIGKDNTVSDTTGFPLIPQARITLDHYTSDLWAICTTGKTSNLAYLQEGA